MNESPVRSSHRLERGLLVVGVMLLAICAYLLATMPQHASATEKIKNLAAAEERVAAADKADKKPAAETPAATEKPKKGAAKGPPAAAEKPKSEGGAIETPAATDKDKKDGAQPPAAKDKEPATKDKEPAAKDKTGKKGAVEHVSDKDFKDEYYRFADVMAEVMVQVREKYVEDVSPDRVFNAALNGVFSALDPHSSYMGPENFQSLEKDTEGEFSGIGIHISLDTNGILTVISPIPGTPGAHAGIRPWDRIIEIEGETTEGITTSGAVKKLTGPVGTKVNIVIWRPADRKRMPMTIVRDRVKIESVYANSDDKDYVKPYFKYLTESKIGYLRLTRFSDNCSQDLRAAIEKMKEKGDQGLILDMRFNSGGLLSEAIRVSELFLDKDQVVVVTKGRLPEQNQTYKAESGKLVSWPMVVLVNEATASASEIVAGALQDHRRAILVGPEGKNTYGKGLVQTILPLRASLEVDKDGNSEQSAVRLTTAKYYTPNNAGPDGKSMHLVGIASDVGVPVSDDQVRDLLTKGQLLGDTVSVEAEKDATAAGDDKKGDLPADKSADKSGNTDKDKTKEKTAVPESPDEGLQGLDANPNGADKPNGVDNKPKGGTDEDSLPFYMQKKRKEADKHPVTPDAQLRYAVDLMRGLMVEAPKRK